MTVTRTFVDAEDVVKAWLLTTSVAPLVTVAGKVHIFLAMPKSSPTPTVTLSRVGGAPVLGDTPVDGARISFDVWAANRPQAKTITAALIGEIESIGDQRVFTTASGRLQAGETVSVLWLPDEDDDTARYVVDAIFQVQAL